MLSFIYTENYKNLKFDGKVDLKNLNIFIGPNGSGKSNLISYLKFLSEGSGGNKRDINSMNSPVETAISQLGRFSNLNLSLPCQVRFVYGFYSKYSRNEEEKRIVLDTKISVDSRSPSFIERESLYMGSDLAENKEPLLYCYYYTTPKIGAGIFYNRGTEEEFLESGEILNFLHGNPRRLRGSLYRNYHFYNSNEMNLQVIRNSEPKIGPDDVFLSTTGDNLALVVDNLSRDIDFEDALNLAIQSIFPKTRRIRSARVGRLSLTVEWFLEGNDEPFYLNEMSDGTVRMLCWAVILHSPNLPTLLVIDEPELGLHPAWLSVLAQWIKKAAEKTQIILTTHSPDLLDKFTDSLEHVYCFYPTDANHYGIKPLSPEVLKPQLEEGWELGDLYRVGDPTVGGWPW
ncbi:MAG: AAA family ATPase [Snowella sp.]|nr:AAA family ATPase [Snowella sp.]